jgi:hypothetical protein
VIRIRETLQSRLTLTSIVDPKAGASGSLTKLGTKNTCNHLASSPAPGFRTLYIFSTMELGTINMSENKAPQPANDDGKEIPHALNIALKTMSIKTKRVVEARVRAVVVPHSTLPAAIFSLQSPPGTIDDAESTGNDRP